MRFSKRELAVDSDAVVTSLGGSMEIRAHAGYKANSMSQECVVSVNWMWDERV